MKCDECGFDNDKDSKICNQCGATLIHDKASAADTTIVYFPSEVEIEIKDEKVVIPIENMKGIKPSLIVLRGPNKGEKFIVDKDELTLGRHPESDIFLGDITVSRNHAKIVKIGNTYEVQDAGSLNGTYVNNEQIEKSVLSDQDVIQVGKFKLMYLTPKVV